MISRDEIKTWPLAYGVHAMELLEALVKAEEQRDTMMRLLLEQYRRRGAVLVRLTEFEEATRIDGYTSGDELVAHIKEILS